MSGRKIDKLQRRWSSCNIFTLKENWLHLVKFSYLRNVNKKGFVRSCYVFQLVTSWVLTGNKILTEIWYKQQKFSAFFVYKDTEVASVKHDWTQVYEWGHLKCNFSYWFKRSEHITLPLWWFCSRISIMCANSSGDTFVRWSSSCSMCERLSISRLRGDPGLAFDEICREYMEEQSPEP